MVHSALCGMEMENPMELSQAQYLINPCLRDGIRFGDDFGFRCDERRIGYLYRA